MKNNRENRIGWGKVCRWAGIWIRLSLFTLFILTEPLVVEAAGQSVTLRLENVSLKEAFKEIKRQLGYRLAYNEQVINTIGNVSVDVVSGNINEVMEQCLRGSDFSYEIENQIIVIYKKQAGADMAAPQKLIKLEGVVVDSKGGVLPGVTVVVKGTTIGVATDIDGKFSLEITETPGISLEFSFVGQFDEDDFFGGRRQQHWHRAPGYRPADCRGHRPGLFRQGADPGQREKAVRRHKGPGAVSGEREGRQELPGLPDHHGAGRPGGKRRGGFRLCHQPGQGI